MISVIIVLISAALWRLGGTDWKIKGFGLKFCRVMILPSLLSTVVMFRTNILFGIFISGLMQIYRIGYGAWDPKNDPKPSILASLTHDQKGKLIRSIAGFLYSLAVLPLVFTGVLSGFHWTVYSLLQILLGWCLAQENVWVAETVIGAGVASFILFLTF